MDLAIGIAFGFLLGYIAGYIKRAHIEERRTHGNRVD
jgi:hypothetical protein